MHSITSKDPSRKTLKDIILKCPQQVLTPVAVSFNLLGQVLLFATCLCYRLTASELAAKQLGNTVAVSFNPLGQVLLFATCLCYRLTASELAAEQLGNTVAQSIDFNFPRDC